LINIDSPRVRPIESRIIVNYSDSAILRCYVDSNPLPYEIIWFKNGYEIFRQNQLSDLRIDHVERNDSGLYTCIVYNRLENNLIKNGSSTIELIVQSRPILETTYSKLAAEIGQTITLTCRVTGEPKAKIFWKRNEQILPCNDIIDDKCYLKLFQITNKDFGSYRCIAENLLGKEEWTYTIVSRGKTKKTIRFHYFCFLIKVNRKLHMIYV
jgi:roundabout axon guidance receptor 4